MINLARLSDQDKLILLGVGVLAFFLAPKIIGSVAKSAAETAVTVPGELFEGAVVGIGKQVGIPETNIDKCQAAIAANDMWEASFQCPAATYLQALWYSTFGR
jgi:hypothetical protein